MRSAAWGTACHNRSLFEFFFREILNPSPVPAESTEIGSRCEALYVMGLASSEVVSAASGWITVTVLIASGLVWFTEHTHRQHTLNKLG